MTRLSSRWTDWYRFGAPLSTLIGISAVKIVAPEILGFATILVTATYTAWYGWRLSTVWLDGGMLNVKGLSTFQVPLSDVTLVDVQKRGRGPIIFFLALHHPVGKVKTVRFIAAGDIERDLRARIHAARAP